MRSLFLALSFLLSTVAQAAGNYTILRYGEGGLWYVQLFKEASDGWQDSVEKRGYPTEKESIKRALFLKRTLGAIEQKATRLPDSEIEIRTPMAGEIWTATKSWSDEWERSFSDWVRTQVDKKFFKKYNIETDCADAAVGLRWIYSRMVGLPAGNNLSWGGAFMTNRSVRPEWKDLPTSANWYEDLKFRAALNYIMAHTYTHSLNQDAYPVEISPRYITEGAFHLEIRAVDGHTRVVSRINRNKRNYPIKDIYSNVPRKVRKLAQESFTVSKQPKMLQGGFLRHRWVKLTPTSASLVPAKNMPGYSLEQYEPSFFKHGIPDYAAEVAARIRESYDPVDGMEAIIKNLKTAIEERKAVVEEGYAFCKAADCAHGTLNYENWSTPSRDERILGYFTQVQLFLKTLRGDDLDRATKLYKRQSKKKLIRLFGKKFRYSDLEKVWLENRFSSNPVDLPQARWGY